MERILCLILFMTASLGFAQQVDTADYAKRSAFIKDFKLNNDLIIKSIKSKYSGKTASEISKFYTEFGKGFEKNIQNRDYLFGSVFDTKIARIIAEIKKTNPEIGNLRVLIAKDNSPNAYCLADGTFVINMGLFNWMDNEAQIAAILAHELAHKTKEHTLKLLLASISEETKDKEAALALKNISVNKSMKAFEIVKNRVYKKGYRKRQDEVQADSLGYVYFKKTGFPKAEFINALANLKEFDTISPRELKTETYRELYNLPKLAFKEKWLQKEDFSLYNYNNYKEKLSKDSLSTHPELDKRIEMLRSNFPELKSQAKASEGDADFLAVRAFARKQILPNFYHSEDYGVGIYSAMQFLQDGEEKEYYKQWLGKCFEKIYEARKNYTLNRYLDRVEPQNQSESYQQFLNFMWNLSLDDIKAIADYYNKKETV